MNDERDVSNAVHGLQNAEILDLLVGVGRFDHADEAMVFGVFLMRFKPGKRFGESAHVGQPTGFAQNEHGGIVHVWGLRKGGGAGWSDSPKEVIFSFCIAQRHTPIVRERDVSCESEEIRSAVGFLTERYFCNGLCEAYFQEYQQAKCVIPL